VDGEYAQIAVADLLERTAAETPAPGGGSIAALTIGLAAALVAMVARSSRGTWGDAAGVAAQAIELAERCPRLAHDDARAWEAAFATLRSAVEKSDEEPEPDAPADERGDFQLGALLASSADLPVVIAETGADVAVLAALAAKLGDGALRADAAAAATLAHAGTRVGAHLVSVNLGTREGDERTRRAEAAEWRAGQAAAEALSAAT
jgi:formiminotetrahydrofolate cyclodeaminase